VIAITNVSPPGTPRDAVHTYTIQINNGPELARFQHIRSYGLAACLRRAAEAVEAAERLARESSK
jgi:hypothetical protein